MMAQRLLLISADPNLDVHTQMHGKLKTQCLIWSTMWPAVTVTMEKCKSGYG